MKTQVELNGRVFIMRVVEVDMRSGYCCQCDSLSSKVEESSTYAISSLYQSIFGTKTKFSGISVMGLDNLQIIAELLANVEFRPFSVEIDKFQIFIYKLGSSRRKEWLNAGPGYSASLVCEYKKKRCVFVQQIEENFCKIDVLCGNEIIYNFKGNTPTDVWKKTGILTKID